VNQESDELCELKENVIGGRKWNNAINKVTHYGLDGRGLHPDGVWDYYLGHKAHIGFLAFSKPPAQRVQEGSSAGLRWPEREANFLTVPPSLSKTLIAFHSLLHCAFMEFTR